MSACPATHHRFMETSRDTAAPSLLCSRVVALWVVSLGCGLVGLPQTEVNQVQRPTSLVLSRGPIGKLILVTEIHLKAVPHSLIAPLSILHRGRAGECERPTSNTALPSTLSTKLYHAVVSYI